MMKKSYSGLTVLSLLLVLLLAACGGVLDVGLETAEPGVTAETPAEPSPTQQVVGTDTAEPVTEEPPEETPTTEEPGSEPTPEETGAPVPETPAPQPDGVAQVAYVQDGNITLWSPDAGAQQLTSSGGVEDVNLSDDGQYVAFTRNGHLWVTNSDGSGEQQLTNDETFASMDLSDISGNVVGIRVYETAWIPGTNSLLFNTSPLLGGPGLLLSNDLWHADIDSGQVTNLRPVGEGGSFVISPDGSRVVLVTPEIISVMNLGSGDVQQVLTYSPVLTYSEFQYYARPVWAPDGSTLRVVIPPADPLGSSEPAAVYELYPDGSPPQLLGQVTIFMAQNHTNVALSPDLSQLAYTQQEVEGSGPGNLYVAPLGQELGDPGQYADSVGEIQGWSPDSRRLAFSQVSGGTPQLMILTPEAGAQPVGSGDAAAMGLQWVDAEQFVYLQNSPSGWDLVLGNLAGETQTIASSITSDGPPPTFDVE
jgi:Tol biopolymer transport system component